MDGIRVCHAKSSKLMLVLDGTHYATPDGLVYDLHGSCSYILAQVCHPKPGDEEFSIVLEKNAVGEPQRVVVSVAGHIVVLAPGPQVSGHTLPKVLIRTLADLQVICRRAPTWRVLEDTDELENPESTTESDVLGSEGPILKATGDTALSLPQEPKWTSLHSN